MNPAKYAGTAHNCKEFYCVDVLEIFLKIRKIVLKNNLFECIGRNVILFQVLFHFLI